MNTLTCGECGRPTVIAWSEPTLLVVPPKGWDHRFEYKPPLQAAHTLLCTHCGARHVTMETLADG